MCMKKAIVLLVLVFTAGIFLTGCASGVTPTQPPAAGEIPLMPMASRTPAPAASAESTALPDALQITWGERWYEGEYTADAQKYPADTVYHERSFNIRVTIQNNSAETVPGEAVPSFYLTDGEGERAVITWYYSPDDLRPLKPGDKKEAVFRALTYAPGQWIARAEVQWRGRVWVKEFPRE